ncbi:hypothetical protein Back11_18510 [Paenibacillus baekrokdamisoli]|uniref:chitinase n=1 Tax=Paenibacillus baekrokdamisoli TaxID=1712516 RepID=A0A3G9IQ54_9BACL|nr:glycosyl hydrolase family 18 protein [Paenibacillus baekrokdamisoli]MBB3072447.1 GH18 family chitinase [Paenibacillus baekrokdamisoli]BBH20506.1 hypothetical protein Back11_18510 [Paenibacillus baekrokdamisoli]
MTHIIHAFLEVNEDGTLNVPDKYLEPNLITSAHAAGVKVIAGINGETIRVIAASPGLRTAFAANIESFCRTNGYDGVDIDWEYPQDAADRRNYTLLMQAIRSKFDSSAAPAPSWSTSMAVSGVDYWGQWLDYAAIDPSITFYNLMAYDMHGPWSSHPGHNSALYPGTEPDPGYSVQEYMDYLLLTRGVSAAKVNLGVPSYGWKFNNSEDLYDSCGGLCTNVEPVYYNRDIPKLIGNGWTRYWDSASSAPYLRKDNGTGFITYDDATSIGDKVDYALDTRGAGGVFMWEISLDYNGSSQPLMDAMYTAAAGDVNPIQVDTTAPTTIDDAPKNWVNKDVTVTLKATDNDSGINATYYKVDHAAEQTGTSVTITAEGEHTLTYWSLDHAGNREDPHTAIVKIDKTAPISGASVSPTIPNGSNGWYTSDVTLSLAASDNLSGVTRTEYRVNNGVWITYNGSIPAFGEGIYEVGYRSTDQAGNIEELQIINVKVKRNTEVPSPNNGNYNPTPAVHHGQIVDDSIWKQAHTGKVTILMEKGNKELLLPINSAALLGNNKLEIKADGVSIGIPSDVLTQLAALLGREAGKEDQIVLKVEKLNATTTTDMVKNGGDKNTTVKAGSGVYQFKLAVVDRNSKEYSLDVFNTPIEVELHYSGESVNADLLGIYYYNEASGQWDYVGGTVNKEQKTIAVQLKHFSQYAVMEYNKTFDDVPSNHWVNNALKVLAAKHVITGLTDITFLPQGEITRAEFVAMLTRLFGLKAKNPSVFTDVDSSKWYADAVDAAYEAKLVVGKTATTFGPDEKVSREEMAVMLVRAYEYKNGKDAREGTKADNPFVDSDQISAWAVEYVQSAFVEGLMKGTGNNRFNPAAYATRADVAQAIYNLLNRSSSTN